MFLMFARLRTKRPSMERNIVIGDRALRRMKTGRGERGFSLLELMIAMFIHVILLSVAIPTYQLSVQHARETSPKENLCTTRRASDHSSVDKGKLPSSVDELVENKYLRERPMDPITEETEWEEIMGDDPNNPDGGQGMTDVKSLA